MLSDIPFISEDMLKCFVNAVLNIKKAIFCKKE